MHLPCLEPCRPLLAECTHALACRTSGQAVGKEGTTLQRGRRFCSAIDCATCSQELCQALYTALLCTAQLQCTAQSCHAAGRSRLQLTGVGHCSLRICAAPMADPSPFLGSQGEAFMPAGLGQARQ